MPLFVAMQESSLRQCEYLINMTSYVHISNEIFAKGCSVFNVVVQLNDCQILKAGKN